MIETLKFRLSASSLANISFVDHNVKSDELYIYIRPKPKVESMVNEARGVY